MCVYTYIFKYICVWIYIHIYLHVYFRVYMNETNARYFARLNVAFSNVNARCA